MDEVGNDVGAIKECELCLAELVAQAFENGGLPGSWKTVETDHCWL